MDRKVKNLQSEIRSERSRRENIEHEIRSIKDTLTQYKNQLAN